MYLVVLAKMLMKKALFFNRLLFTGPEFSLRK